MDQQFGRVKILGTKYALRLIPLGGFVNMEGEEERSDSEGSFSKTSIPKRIAIVAAGGLVNIIFALIVYWILATATGGVITTKISDVYEEYGANLAGIIKDDEIIKVNGKRVRHKTDLDEEMSSSNREKVKLLIKRNNEEIEIEVMPTTIPSKDTGIYLGAEGDDVSTKVVALYPNSPAEKEGIKVKDEILKIDGKDVNNDPYKVVEYISQSENEKVIFTLKRDEETIEIGVKPDVINNYILGVELKQAEDELGSNIYYGFWQTVEFSTSIIENLKMLFTGQVSTNQLMGPIGISSIVADTKGIQDFIYLLALISLSLGVTNLLPFPPLDGGKIVIYIIEAIRRKPMKESIEMGIQTAGFAVLIALSVFVAFNDVLRIF